MVSGFSFVSVIPSFSYALNLNISTDKDIIVMIDKQPSSQAYVKRLIHDALAARGITPMISECVQAPSSKCSPDVAGAEDQT